MLRLTPHLGSPHSLQHWAGGDTAPIPRWLRPMGSVGRGGIVAALLCCCLLGSARALVSVRRLLRSLCSVGFDYVLLSGWGSHGSVLPLMAFQQWGGDTDGTMRPHTALQTPRLGSFHCQCCCFAHPGPKFHPILLCSSCSARCSQTGLCDAVTPREGAVLRGCSLRFQPSCPGGGAQCAWSRSEPPSDSSGPTVMGSSPLSLWAGGS